MPKFTRDNPGAAAAPVGVASSGIPYSMVTTGDESTSYATLESTAKPGEGRQLGMYNSPPLNPVPAGKGRG